MWQDLELEKKVEFSLGIYYILGQYKPLFSKLHIYLVSYIYYFTTECTLHYRAARCNDLHFRPNSFLHGINPADFSAIRCKILGHNLNMSAQRQC